MPTSRGQPLIAMLRTRALALATLDLRSLALFRIGLGAVLLLDLVLRAQDLVAHYTAAGILSLEQLPPSSPLITALAPHLHVTSIGATVCLFGVSAAAAAAVMLGVKTRWMVALSWFMLHSLQLRNPFVNHAGDKLLILLLFWAIFLPLDRYYTLGKRPQRAGLPATRRIASFATAALVIQIASVYFMSALRKGGDMWHDGTAIWYALQIDQYARPWTRSLLEFPSLLKALTWSTLAVEYLAPCLLLIGPGRFRMVGVVMLAGLPLGFLCSLELGIFPLVGLVGMIPLIPQRITGSSSSREQPPLTWEHRLAAYLLFSLIAWHAATLFRYPDDIKRSLPRAITVALETIRFDQFWSMFAPNPMTFDGWYLVEAKTTEGTPVDLLNPSQPLRRTKPSRVRFPSDRWKEYLMTLSDLGDPPARWQSVVNRLERQYELNQGKQIQSDTIRVIYMMERTTPQGEARPEAEQAWPRDDSF